MGGSDTSMLFPYRTIMVRFCSPGVGILVGLSKLQKLMYLHM